MGALRKALAGLGCVILLVAMALAALQLPPIKQWAVAQAASALAGGPARIGPVEGMLPFDIRLAEAHLADADGEWLSLRDLVVELSPRALLRGRIEIRTLAAGEIAMARLPASAPVAPPTAQPWQLPALPRLPVAALLHDLHVDSLRLAAPVLGEPVVLAVRAAAGIAGARASARLAVKRIDGEAGEADLTLVLDGEPARLSLAMTIAEPSGVVVGRLLGRDDRPALAVALHGDGPLADWRGALTASAGSIARVDTTLGVAFDGAYRLSLNGTLQVRELLPPDLGAVLGDSVALDAQASVMAPGNVRIDRFTIEAANVAVEATGTYDDALKAVAADATLVAASLAPLSGLAGMPLSGAARIRLSANGSVARPLVDMRVDASELRADQNGASRIEATLRLTPDGDVGRAETRYAVEGNGRVTGITRSDAPIASGLGGALEWRLSGATDAAGDHLELSLLEVATGGVSLIGSGTVRDRGAVVDGKATMVVDDLGRWSELAGRPLGGKGRLELTVSSARSGDIEADLQGNLTEAKLGLPALDALLAGSLQLAGKARRDSAGVIMLADLSVSGTHVQVQGAGELAPGDSINGRLSVALPKLAALDAVVGLPINGRLGLQATVRGRLDSLDVRAELDGAGIAAAGRKLDRLHATLTGTGGSAPAGRLDGSFRSGDLDGVLAGTFALREAFAVLDISHLRLAAAGTTLDAKLRTSLDTLLTSGTVTGKVADLAPWSGLAGAKIAGRAELKAVLGSKGGQSVDLEFNGSGLKLGTTPGQAITVDRVAARGRLADLLGKPSGRGSVELGKAGTNGLDLRTLSLQIGSTKPGRFNFEAKAEGKFRERFALAAAGDTTLGNRQVALTLSRLSGTVAGETVQLRRPLSLARRGSGLSFADLDLALGDGQLAGSGALEGPRMSLSLKADRLPVGLAAKLAGKPGVSGTVSAEARLSGTRANPQGRLAMEGRTLRLAAVRQGGMPSLGVSVEAEWRDGRVALNGRVTGPKSQAIGFSGELPLELAPDSLAVRLPAQRPLTLALRGEAQLADLQDLLPLGEDRVAGQLAIDVRVGGTVAQPTAAGTLTIRAGRYESMAMGTVVNDIALDLAGDRQQFLLREFRATDGERGQLMARGSVNLAATPGPALDAAVSMRSFRALRRDEANVAVTGDVRVSGPLTTPRAVAQLRVEQAELRLPERLPTRVAALDVVEINSTTGDRPAATREPEPGAAGTVGLDIQVDLPGKVFVRGRGLDGEWRGSLAVTGTGDRPIIIGSLLTVRGTVNVLDRTFTLTRGIISFTGGAKIDPGLDILAETKAGDITGTVQLSGTALSPKIKIGSQPEMPQDEVLARILFGRSVTQITPAQGLRLAAAAASLVGGGPSYLDGVRGSLGLDRFDLGSGSGGKSTVGNAGSAAGGLGGTTVSAGKYVSDRVYVGVDQGLGAGSSRAKVEIEITPNVSVETSVGAAGGNAVGLNWKVDY